MEIPCLGRAFSPGLLYDARSDKLLPLSLWNKDKLEKACITEEVHHSDFSISAGKSLKDKLDLLGVSAQAKLGFLGGLISAEGSASYLNEKREKRNEVSVTLVYRAEVESRRLDMRLFDEDQGIDHPRFLDVGATHVVMETTYGANAVFEFKKEVTDLSEKEDIKGNLSLVINKFPGISISGDGKLEMDKHDTEVTENLTVSFQGDFIIEDSPATFEQAVDVYKKIPGKEIS